MRSDKKLWKSNDFSPENADSKLDNRQLVNFGYETIPVAEKSQKVIAHFDSIAGRYDFMNTLLSFGIHYLWKRTAVRLLALKSGERVLDVCGGTGDLSILAVKAVKPDGRVVLYDINRSMIQAGKRKKTNEVSRQKIFYVQGDAEKISFPDQVFDAVMIGFGIRNLTQMEKGFKEIYRVIKLGGRMMCLEFSKPTAPFFRWLYDMYSFQIMPFLGQMIVENRKAYTHLPESIRTFPLPDRLAKLIRGVGFRQVRYYKLTNGIAYIHLARKGQLPFSQLQP